MLDIKDISFIRDGKSGKTPTANIIGRTLGDVTEDELMAAIFAAKPSTSPGAFYAPEGPITGGGLGIPEIAMEDNDGDDDYIVQSASEGAEEEEE